MQRCTAESPLALTWKKMFCFALGRERSILSLVGMLAERVDVPICPGKWKYTLCVITEKPSNGGRGRHYGFSWKHSIDVPKPFRPSRPKHRCQNRRFFFSFPFLTFLCLDWYFSSPNVWKQLREYSVGKGLNYYSESECPDGKQWWFIGKKMADGKKTADGLWTYYFICYTPCF